MWRSDHWNEYELLDCGAGERLERWGKYLLVRPDPQAIWRREGSHPGWKRHDGRYQRSSTGGGAWVKKDLPERWTLDYGALTFNIKPMNFKHTGLFPEQAANWDFAMQAIRAAGRPVSVRHVDAAKGMVSWARENAKSSGLEQAPIRWIVDDCGKFVEREIRRGRRYDAVIMDPPSYGRGPSGEIWKLEENLPLFLELAAQVLSDAPIFFLINSYTTGLSPSVLTYLLETIVSRRYGGHTESQELGLPVTATGLSLPCGATGRWVCG